VGLVNIFEVTSVYAGIFGVLFFIFTMRVGLYRAKNQISFGDGGDAELTKRVRAHGNFVESVPIALILLGLAEAGGASTTLLHVAAVMLLVGRLSHWLQLSGFIKPIQFRMAGMILSFASVLTTSVWLLQNSF
jgi:uncharacterized protein